MPKPPGCTFRGVSGPQSGTTQVTLNKPLNTANDDVLLLFLTHKGLDWGVFPAGWEVVQQNVTPDGTVRGECYWHRVGPGEPANYTITGLADVGLGVIVNYPGCVKTGSPIGASTSRGNASGVNGTGSLLTPEDDMVLVVSGHWGLNNVIQGFGNQNGLAAERPRDQDISSFGIAVGGQSATGTDCAVGVAHTMKIVAGPTASLGWNTSPAAQNVGIAVALRPDRAETVGGPTRYYLSQGFPGTYMLGPLQGGWGGAPTPNANSINQPTYLLSQSKAALGPLSYFYRLTCNQQNHFGLFTGRWMTPALDAQTISGTFDLMFARAAWFENAGAQDQSDVRYKVHVYVTVGQTVQVRTTLLDRYVDPVRFPYLSSTCAGLAAPVALTPGACLPGDSVLVEIGVEIVTSPVLPPTYPPTTYTVATLAHNGGAIRNSRCAPAYVRDKVAGDIETDTVPWLQFSHAFIEQAATVAPPPNDTPETALDLAPLPYESPTRIDTTRSRYANRSVWYTYTSPVDATIIFALFGTGYYATVEFYRGAPGALITQFSRFISNRMQFNRCQTTAMLTATAGTTYYIRVLSHVINGLQAGGLSPSSGGSLFLRVSVRDIVPLPDDIYVPSLSVVRWRGGVIADTFPDLMGFVPTGCALSYARTPMDDLNGGQHAGDRFYLGLHDSDVIEILDANTLNQGDYEIDWIDEPVFYLDPWGRHVGTLAIDPANNLVIGFFGNGYLYVSGEATTDKAAFLDSISNPRSRSFIRRLPAVNADNQPGAPFPAAEYFDVTDGPASPNHVALSPDGSVVFYTAGAFYIGSTAQTVHRYDLANRVQLPDFATVAASSGPTPGLRGLCVHPNGTVFVCNGNEVVWLSAAGAVLHVFTPTPQAEAFLLMDVQVSTDGAHIFVLDGNSASLWTFDLFTRQQTRYVQTHQANAEVSQIAVYHPSGIIANPNPGGPEPEPEKCECCMATELEIWNDALGKLGVSQFVVALDELSKEAQLCARWYPKALKETLRSHPWGFATKYAAATGAPVGGAMELVAGSETVPVNGDWRYAYRYPSDCVMGRRIVPKDGPAMGAGRTFGRTPIPWRPGRTTTFGPDDDYQLIFTNEPNAVLEYTALVACRIEFNDALFEDALSSRLAWKLCPSLVRDKATAIECLTLFKQAISDAAVMDMREQQQEPDGEHAAWNEGR